MKLETTLPERPGFLHVVPAFNLLALLLILVVLGPSLILQSGVSVNLPVSRFQMERFRDSLVISITAGEPARIYLGRDIVGLDRLEDALERKRNQSATTTVLLRTDVGTPAGIEREVCEMVLHKGFRLVMVGRPPQSSGVSAEGGGRGR